MNPPLANAESWDWTQADFVLILLCAVGIAVVFALAGLIIIVAKRRWHRDAGPLTAVTMFWGLITIASIAYVTVRQLMWAKENFLELLSGYGNPDQSAPGLPWLAWGFLSLVYVALAGWATLRR